MNKNVVYAALLLIAVVVAGYVAQLKTTGNSPAAAPAEIASADDKFQFELNDIDGNLRSSTEWDGKARLVNFWATWCAPCRREIPLLISTQEKYASSNLQIIGIAVDFPDAVADYANDANFNYPILVGQEDAMAVAESSGIDFIGLPFTMVVSADGDLLKTHIGEVLAAHIETITAVLAKMEQGELNLEGARSALRSL